MSDPIAPLIENLHAQGRLRVWSLVITAFGDLFQHRGGAVSSGRLGRLLGRVGVEQGTMRTAMSRLGQDGWVSSERRGRLSLYRLSQEGLDTFAPATARIYAAPRRAPVAEWALAATLTGGAPELRLTPADEAGPADLLVTGQLARLSDAWRATLLPEAHRAALDGLARDLRALHTTVISDPLDAAAARMLLIHRWRRIVLRYADLPPELMPADTPLAEPRRQVAETYARIAPLAETWLDTAEDDPDRLPPADGRFALRFRGPQQA